MVDSSIIESDENPHENYFQIKIDNFWDKNLEDLEFRIIRLDTRIVFQDPYYITEEIK